MNRNSLSFAGAVAVALSLMSARAQASETYPAAVQEALGLACAPACVLCHTRPEGGIGTYNAQFGTTIRATNIGIRNPGGIAAALACIENGVDEPSAESCPYGSSDPAPDSDGDGTPDIEELRNAENPSSTSGGSFCGATYGCGASIAPKRHFDGVAASAALLSAFALLWTLRRRAA
ncbi:MAG TPA: hypothetical protein VK524_32660 [Polyangiaceae bacterium]|nr:hypothetical protein [Polyangiaceae bacterium]